jgi:hypothetical protein
LLHRYLEFRSGGRDAEMGCWVQVIPVCMLDAEIYPLRSTHWSAVKWIRRN